MPVYPLVVWQRHESYKHNVTLVRSHVYRRSLPAWGTLVPVCPVLGTVNVHVYIHLTHCCDCTPVVQTGHPDQGRLSLTSKDV